MIKALSAKWDGWQNRVTGLIDNRVVSVSLIFVIFFGAGTTLTYRSLSYPWHWDDLHLVRTFSTAELASVFRGNWDVDDIENSGYRPLTVVFNHLRAAAFGECVVAHRLFDVALVAAYLALLASLAMRLRLSYGGAVLGGILAISAKNNWWNLVWICDGIHAFMELLVLLAAYFTLSAVRKFAIWKIVLATLFAGLGLLVRDPDVRARLRSAEKVSFRSEQSNGEHLARTARPSVAIDLISLSGACGNGAALFPCALTTGPEHGNGR
jgi:hypothetical protein